VRRLASALLLLGGLAQPVAARPTYFEVFTQKFGLLEGVDRLHACGVCHYRWEGTGARNPFGTSVEQQLYLQKPISDAIDAAVPQDPDGDGFTSLEEIETHATLPGYSCANFFDAIEPPLDWHTFIIPGVPSCLEPKDIRAAPTVLNLNTDAGKQASGTITIYNNGKDDPIQVLSYALLPGAGASLSLQGPPAPFTLAVGGTAEIEVLFAPPVATLENTALEIESDDPDEPTLGIGVTAIGRVQPLAPADERADCLKDVDREARELTKKHTKEWARCHGDEVAGLACDAGARDRKLLGASAKLHDAIGGPKDKRCAGADLRPRQVGQPEACGGGCGSIALRNFGDLADCLACRQEQASGAMLAAALGAAPPDVPASTSRDAARCASKLLKALGKGIAKTQQILGRCELDNVTASPPQDCEAALAGDLERVRADVDASLARCDDVEGLAGCYAGKEADPACLGEAAVAIGAGLVDVSFGLEE
jgi:hypothetical protein